MVDAKNEADQMIFATEKAIDEAGDKITEDDKKTLKDAIEKAKKDLVEAKDAETVRKITEEMTKANAPIFTQLYQAAQADAQAKQEGATKNDDGSVNPDDIIIDGGDNQ